MEAARAKRDRKTMFTGECRVKSDDRKGLDEYLDSLRRRKQFAW
jgi:hypothetical protein